MIAKWHEEMVRAKGHRLGANCLRHVVTAVLQDCTGAKVCFRITWSERVHIGESIFRGIFDFQYSFSKQVARSLSITRPYLEALGDALRPVLTPAQQPRKLRRFAQNCKDFRKFS